MCVGTRVLFAGVTAFVSVLMSVIMLVLVRYYLVMFLTGRPHRVYVNCGAGQVLQAVQEPLMSFPSDTVTFLHRKVRINGYVHLGQ